MDGEGSCSGRCVAATCHAHTPGALARIRSPPHTPAPLCPGPQVRAGDPVVNADRHSDREAIKEEAYAAVLGGAGLGRVCAVVVVVEGAGVGVGGEI
jgi:hypothetical protein